MSLTSAERSASQSREVLREHRDAWLMVLGVGFLVIVFGNLFGGGPWLVALLVAAVMIGYAFFVGRFVDEADVPGDTKGESIYYLGLLFTFAAMIAGLITFDWETPGTDTSGTTGAIRNFGIALLTTIVGLAGRVWFTMSHESPGDIVDTTRSELEETVSRMKESLDRARDDLESMAIRFGESSAGLGEIAEIIAQRTKKTAETYEALDEYAGRIAGATRLLTKEMGQLRTVYSASAHAMTVLQDRAERLGTRFNDVQAQFAEVEGTFDTINKVAGPAAERVNATLQGLESTDAAVSAFGKTLSGVRGSADRAKQALAGIADAVDRHGVLPLFQEAVEQLHVGTRGIRGIGEQAGEMNAEFDGLKASVKAAREGLASVPGRARAINEQLRGVGPELTVSIGPVRGLARELNADLTAAGEQSAELSGALEDARQQARGLTEELREAAGVGMPGEPAVSRTTRIRRAMAKARRGLTRRGLARLARFRRKS